MSSIKNRVSHTAQTVTRGIHHLALNTDDMKKTIDFYVDILGMPIIHALRVPPGVGVGSANRGNPPYENLRHYFFDAGGDTLVAFFELPGEAGKQGSRDVVAAMQHCSFTTTEENFHILVDRLRTNGVPMIGPVNVGVDTYSMYFMDPNGIRLEFSYQEGDGDDVRVVERWTQTKDEILQELSTLSDDHDWKSKLTLHLPAA